MRLNMARDITYWQERVELEKDLATKRKASLEKVDEANRKLCGE